MMDDPNADEMRLTLGRINRANMALSFLQQAVVQLQNSGLTDYQSDGVNRRERIVNDLIRAGSDLRRMIDDAERNSKIDIRS
jgi:hypothetical protein